MPRKYITKRYINKVRETVAHGLIDFGNDSPAVTERFFQFLELLDKTQADHLNRFNEQLLSEYQAVWTELSALPQDYAANFSRVLTGGCSGCACHRDACIFNTLYLIFSSIANRRLTGLDDPLPVSAFKKRNKG